jgi:hypothetical protein
MCRVLFVRLAIVSSLCVAVPAAAQTTLPIAVDQRVRVWTDAADAVTGRVAAVTSDTVQVAVDGRDAATLAVSAIRRVEVSRSRTSRGQGFKKGALRGALIAGVLGAISLGLQHDQVGEDGSSAAKAAALGAWSGGLFGGLIGGAIGAARAGDEWEQTYPAR